MAQGKESACSARDPSSIPGLGRSPEEGNGNPLQYSCLESHGQRSLVGYSPWGHRESDTTEWPTLPPSSCFFNFIWSMSFSDFPCPRLPWQFWGTLASLYSECLNLGSLVGAMSFGEQDRRDECHSHHRISRACNYHLASLNLLALITWLRPWLPGFSTKTVHFPLATVFGSKLINTAHKLGN